MTKNNAVILRKAFPIFHRDCDEISPENRPAAQEISPCSRNDNKVYNDFKITIP